MYVVMHNNSIYLVLQSNKSRVVRLNSVCIFVVVNFITFLFFSYKCFVQRIIKEIFAGCLHFICGKKITIKIMLSFWTVKKCRFNLNNHYYDCYFFIVHHLSGYCHAHMRQYGQMWCAISKHKLQVMQRNAFNQNKN